MRNSKSILFQVTAMIISIAVTTVVLNRFSVLVARYLLVNYDWRFELSMILGMVIFQYPVIYKYPKSIKLTYYYEMLLVSLRGSLLICPILLLNKFFVQPDWLNISWFTLVVLFMFFNHKKSVIALDLPWYTSYNWIGYRLIILLLIT